MIEFKDVNKVYPNGTVALDGVNLKIADGEFVFIVGESGAGKTTLMKLLLREEKITSGSLIVRSERVLDNGRHQSSVYDLGKIRNYKVPYYRRELGVVFQDFRLFSFTLGQNVATASNYDPEKVTDALEKSGFSQRLSELPNGLDTYLYRDVSDSGIELSGGEAQKIALARALYKNAPFLVLDEPTFRSRRRAW